MGDSMRIATLLLCVTVLGACGGDSDRQDEEMRDLLQATTALVRASEASDGGKPMFERVETNEGTVVFAVWANGDHEIWRVGLDGTVITLAYRNKGGSLIRTESSVRETSVR